MQGRKKHCQCRPKGRLSLTFCMVQMQKLGVQKRGLSSRQCAIPSRHSRSSFFVLLHLRGSVSKPRVAWFEQVSKTSSRRKKRERTILRKHIFKSCLSLLHPPVHLRHLLAWQASRARKSSLQATGLTIRHEGFKGVNWEHTEPVGILRVHLDSWTRSNGWIMSAGFAGDRGKIRTETPGNQIDLINPRARIQPDIDGFAHLPSPSSFRNPREQWPVSLLCLLTRLLSTLSAHSPQMSSGRPIADIP